MLTFKKLKQGILSLSTEQGAKHLVVMVETNEEPVGYTTDNRKPNEANLFDNLQEKWKSRLGFPVNVAVLSLKQSFIREHSPSAVYETIDNYIRNLAKEGEIKSSKVGVIIVSSDIARSTIPNCWHYLNVLMRNPSEKVKKAALDFPIYLPIESRFSYTLSIPSYSWLATGSIKEDGAGINLLGFIVRAAEVVLFKQTEGSIFKRMQDYHAGYYGRLKIVRDIPTFKKMMRDLRKKKYNSIDTEADSLRRINNNVLALQFATVNKSSDVPKMWVLPLFHSESPWTPKEIKYITKTMRNYLEVECLNQTHVYQNAKFDIHQLKTAFDIRWYAADIYDVSAGSFSLEENQKFLKLINAPGYSLEAIEGRMEYNRPPHLVIKKADRGRMATFSMQEIADYGVIDVLTPLFVMFEQIAIAKHRGYPNFARFIKKQIGVMLMAMTEMEHNGIPVDLDYLREIASPLGPLSQQIREAAHALQSSPAAIQANEELLGKTSYQKRGLFGAAKTPQLWNIRDQKHLAALFFDTLGLEPLGFKKDGSGKLNAAFQKVYRHTKEVAQFTTYNKLQKLKSAFATAIYKFLISHPDMKIDGRLRPIFTYLDVLTGRSCFAGRTKVQMSDGSTKFIKDILIGEYVRSFNMTTEEYEDKAVTNIISVHKKTVFVEIVNGSDVEIFECTADHPFLSTSGVYIPADLLPSGLPLRSESRTYFRKLFNFNYENEVYDITVEDNHNFLVGEAGIVVHNSTIKPSSQQLPTHGKLAKIIKSQFAVKKGRIRGKRDMSGHEVRVSGNLSKDEAICGAVDKVNAALMQFRKASPEDLAKALEILAADGDLHVNNYETFFDVKITKKDERRQDAKSAVFATSYGSSARSIGIQQHTAALFAVEDKLLTPDLDPKERRILEKKLRWLQSEAGEQFYFEKATDLLDVLFKKWHGLDSYIKQEQGIARNTNVVFGPHGRPRHIWGYLHHDVFVHYAMDRRVFNSESQGYASDYGYTSIYLEKKVYWDLFESRGYEVDILQDNAVHDSSMADMDFRFLPLYTYVAEHAATSLTMDYYRDIFKIRPKTLYGYDLEVGIRESDMMTYSQRPESLVEIINKYAPESGISSKVQKEILHDWEILSKLRTRELFSKNPWNMTLANDNVYDSIVPRLKMFK